MLYPSSWKDGIKHAEISIHAEKHNPKIRGAHTQPSSHGRCAHPPENTFTHTAPLSHYSISCTLAHTFTFNYLNSDALMQGGTYKHPAARAQVFVCVCLHTWAGFIKIIHKSQKQWQQQQQSLVGMSVFGCAHQCSIVCRLAGHLPVRSIRL